MKTIEIQLYKFEELSTEAQQRAIQKWRESDTDYFFSSDNEASLKAFTDIFPIQVKEYSYDAWNHNERTMYSGEADYETLSGPRLMAFLHNNYGCILYPAKTYRLKSGATRKSRIIKDTEMTLTGYYIDNVLLQPIYDFLQHGNNTDFEDLLADCIYQWGIACMKDCEYQQSDTCIKETIQANDYDFNSEGEIYYEHR